MSHVKRHEELRLLLGGDTMLGRRVSAAIQRFGPTYPLGALSTVTRAADAFFVNLECAISDRQARYAGAPKAFYFRACSRAGDALKEAGVDLVSLANNHALDADEIGLRDTVRILGDQGIRHVGAGENFEAASRPAQVQCKGVRLGVVAWCDHQRDFAARADRAGIRYVDLEQSSTRASLAREVRELARSVDHVVVSFHWQPNWVPSVPADYRNLGRELVHAGARIVWGHSPHHFQGFEWVDQSVVLYSTGGLVDDYAVHPEYRNDRQLLMSLDVGPRGVMRVRALPIELDFGCTRPASKEAREWTFERFARMCEELGSRVTRQREWFQVESTRGPEKDGPEKQRAKPGSSPAPAETPTYHRESTSGRSGERR